VTAPTRFPPRLALAALPVALLLLLLVSVGDRSLTQWLYVNATYYCSWAAVLCWGGRTCSRRATGRQGPARLGEGELPGPGRRPRGDGRHRAGRGARAAGALGRGQPGRDLEEPLRLGEPPIHRLGKYYYESYWDIDVAIDQRPPLFPFALSLVHAVAGYSYRNAFLLNLLLLPPTCW
jgi:hypothetical protein